MSPAGHFPTRRAPASSSSGFVFTFGNQPPKSITFGRDPSPPRSNSQTFTWGGQPSPPHGPGRTIIGWSGTHSPPHSPSSQTFTWGGQASPPHGPGRTIIGWSGTHSPPHSPSSAGNEHSASHYVSQLPYNGHYYKFYDEAYFIHAEDRPETTSVTVGSAVYTIKGTLVSPPRSGHTLPASIKTFRAGHTDFYYSGKKTLRRNKAPSPKGTAVKAITVKGETIVFAGYLVPTPDHPTEEDPFFIINGQKMFYDGKRLMLSRLPPP